MCIQNKYFNKGKKKEMIPKPSFYLDLQKLIIEGITLKHTLHRLFCLRILSFGIITGIKGLQKTRNGKSAN